MRRFTSASRWPRACEALGLSLWLAMGATQARAEPTRPPEPFTVTFEATRPELPEPFTVTFEATRPELPEPFTVTFEAIRPELPEPPEPTAVTVTVSKPEPPPPPEPTAVTVSVERPSVDLSRARAALAACDFAAMKIALDELKTLSDRIDQEGREILAKLEREREADAAFGRAKEHYLAGDLDRSEAELDAADATSCPDRKARIASNRVKIEKLRGWAAKVDSAIATCRLADIEAMSDHLSAGKHIFLKRLKAELDAAKGPISSARSDMDGSKPHFRNGDLAAAERLLKRAEGRLEQLPGKSACERMRSDIRDGLADITSLRSALAQADAAIRSCDLPAIERLTARFAGRSHVLIEGKLGELRRAAKRCGKEKEEEAVADANARCRARQGTGSEAYREQASDPYRCRCANGYRKDGSGKTCITTAQAEREGERYCATTYRRGILREVKADGGYKCGCEKGTYADKEQKACLTWDEVVANAQAGCKADGMILATVKGPRDYGCCPGDTHTFDKATNSCWTWDNMVADANAQCGQKGQVAAWINGVNDYLCCPAGTNRFDSKTNTCHNDAAAAQELIQGLGTILEGLGGLSGGRNRGGRTGGGYSCANPPPGCHCRPGSTKFHCGKESGGTNRSGGSRQSGPKFTGCRWQRATIAGFGNRSGWACRCNEGTIAALAPQYCGPKPN